MIQSEKKYSYEILKYSIDEYFIPNHPMYLSMEMLVIYDEKQLADDKKLNFASQYEA